MLPHEICGVPGTLTIKARDENLFDVQSWKSNTRPFPGIPKASIRALIRFDDQCKNKHNTFSVTGEVFMPGARDIEMGACLHEEISKHFPELAHLIKWHLVSSDGPMYYLANTLYHADDKDHWGKRKGEPTRSVYSVLFNQVPIPHPVQGPKFWSWLQSTHLDQPTRYEIVEVPNPPGTYGPHYTFKGFDASWGEAPFKDQETAKQWVEALFSCELEFRKTPIEWSEGKEPDLEAARSCAVWPDATLEQLRDKAALEARLPGLLAEFRNDIEKAGFKWKP